MLATRLNRALDSGALELPETGRIAVFGARADDDVSALPMDRIEVIQSFRPDHDAQAARGVATVVAPHGCYAAAIVCLPRARDAGRARIAAAAAHSDGMVIVDGQKTDGVDAMLRACRARADIDAPVVKAHGKLFAFAAAGSDMAGWAAAPIGLAEGFVTWPGVFSADGIDPGSALLAEALPDRLPARVADFGAGWGYLAARALTRPGIARIDLVEGDHDALDCARRNVPDSRARFHWADALTFAADTPYDAILANPPFHTGRAPDPALGQAFIAAAARNLAPGGVLWMVANRHLPYRAALDAAFRDVQTLLAHGGYSLYRAARPVGPTPAHRRPSTSKSSRTPAR